MQTTQLRITGMKCTSCVAHVEKALKAVPGVAQAKVDLNGEATVRHENVDAKSLLAAIEAAGRYRGAVA